MLLHYALVTLGFQAKYFYVEGKDEALEGLLNGTYDICASTEVLESSTFYYETLDYTVPVNEDKPFFIVKEPQTGQRFHSLLLSVCHWSVWGLLSLAFAVVLAVSYLAKYLPRSFVVSPWFISRSTSEGSMLTWSIVITVLLNVYANLLAITLSRPPEASLPFSTVHELSEILAKSECKAVMDRAVAAPGEPIFQVLNPDSTNASLPFDEATRRNFARAFRINPPLYVSSEEELAETVLSHKGCYVGVDFITTKRIYDAKYCGLMFVESDQVPKRPYVYTFRKELTISTALKLYLTQGAAIDLYDKMIEELAIMDRVKCAESTDGADTDPRPLALIQMVDTFWLLIGASAAAGISVFVERYMYGRRRSSSSSGR